MYTHATSLSIHGALPPQLRRENSRRKVKAREVYKKKRTREREEAEQSLIETDFTPVSMLDLVVYTREILLRNSS